MPQNTFQEISQRQPPVIDETVFHIPQETLGRQRRDEGEREATGQVGVQPVKVGVSALGVHVGEGEGLGQGGGHASVHCVLYIALGEERRGAADARGGQGDLATRSGMVVNGEGGRMGGRKGRRRDRGGSARTGEGGGNDREEVEVWKR